MRLLLALVATAIASVRAFSDTSPFLLLSSSSLPESSSQALSVQIGSRDYVLNTTKFLLSKCSSEIYYVLTQPSLPEQMLQNVAPNLIQAINNPGVNIKFSVSETVALRPNDGEGIVRYLENTCGGRRVNGWAFNEVENQIKHGKSLIVAKNLDGDMVDSDTSIFKNVLSQITKYKYTIIFTTIPPEYTNADLSSIDDLTPESLHTELRREIQARAHNISVGADLRPLFEKYQFLSPGLFMGLFVTLILMFILTVGITAISCLEVSYGAFEKEFGPSVVKK